RRPSRTAARAPQRRARDDGTYSRLLVEDLRAAVDQHAPAPLLAAFLLHDAANAQNDRATTAVTTTKSEEESGGRCRIRTCDPCRVNRRKVVGRPTSALASPRTHWRSGSCLGPTF